MKKYILMILSLILVASVFGQQIKTKIMSFDNPGARRILKTETENNWYYRSLPEKAMILNVAGVEKIQLRSFGIEKLAKPQITLILNGKRNVFDLKEKGKLNGYILYENIVFDIPQNQKTIEVLCYQRSIYMRSFQLITVQPKPKKAPKLPNLAPKAHAGMIDVVHNGITSEYYSFNTSQPLKFTLNNARNASVYIRVKLTDRSLPVFALYHNGKKIQTLEFGLSRTTKYTAQGVKYLSIGKKLDLPINAGSAEYELRAESDHLFMARPVLIKK